MRRPVTLLIVLAGAGAAFWLLDHAGAERTGPPPAPLASPAEPGVPTPGARAQATEFAVGQSAGSAAPSPSQLSPGQALLGRQRAEADAAPVTQP